MDQRRDEMMGNHAITIICHMRPCVIGNILHAALAGKLADQRGVKGKVVQHSNTPTSAGVIVSFSFTTTRPISLGYWSCLANARMGPRVGDKR